MLGNPKTKIKGRKQSEETKTKRSKSIKKLKWFNNGLINKRASYPPDSSFKPGRVNYRRNNN